jgi:hypothetical protein
MLDKPEEPACRVPEAVTGSLMAIALELRVHDKVVAVSCVSGEPPVPGLPVAVMDVPLVVVTLMSYRWDEEYGPPGTSNRTVSPGAIVIDWLVKSILSSPPI